jgi:lysophospholipase L1-like esterase
MDWDITYSQMMRPTTPESPISISEVNEVQLSSIHVSSSPITQASSRYTSKTCSVFNTTAEGETTFTGFTQEELDAAFAAKPSYKKWHILKLRTKLDYLGKNNRGERAELIARLDDYYNTLPEKISKTTNPWICDNIEDLLHDTKQTTNHNQLSNTHATQSQITTSEDQSAKNQLFESNILELVGVIEQLSNRLMNIESTIKIESTPHPQYIPEPTAHKQKPTHQSAINQWQPAKKPTNNNKKSLPNDIDEHKNNRYEALSQLENEQHHHTNTSSTKKHIKPKITINHPKETKSPTQMKISPGNGTYAKAVKENRNVAIFSDSMCSRMGKQELKTKLKCGVNKKAFPGATSQDLHTHYMIPTLKQAPPDTAIIHCGINDVLQRLDDKGGIPSETVEDIADNVISCGQVCRLHGVNKVCISSIIQKRGTKELKSSINLINNSIARRCASISFDFLLNSNIPYNESEKDALFYTDGLHLNPKGKNLLISNFEDYLNTD